jgi:hypothetical protein
MPEYRYKISSLRKLAGKTALRNALFVFVIFCVIGFATPPRPNWQILANAFFLAGASAAAALVAWSAWRGTVRRGGSVRVLLEPETLTVHTGAYSLNISPEQVTAFRILPAGVLLRGTGADHTFILRDALDEFQDLRNRLESWVPPHIPRVPDRGRFPAFMWALQLIPAAFIIGAFTVRSPLPSLGLSLLSAALLCGCAVYIYRSSAIAPQTKRVSILALCPVTFSLLYVAWIRLGQL